ncbi:MAG: ferrochelatase [Acidobacteriaceae bacterium]|jgi:ferrochelatase|nr:ferrochelatase [Acidobacteriaceae bacterium]
MARPFDAVLVVAFGGPQGMADIRPFLANVLRGRRIPPSRVEEVATHYERFGGVSPLTAITMRQADGLRERLRARGIDLPVFVGMRNWHPLLPDTVRAMAGQGITRAVGFVCAAHRSYSGCAQYRQNVVDARAETVASGARDVEVTYVGDWHTSDGFVQANADHVRAARERLAAPLRPKARLVFTAHSIPMSMAGVERYTAQLLEAAARVAAAAGFSEWALVYQSRSGRPEDPWLGPDISDYLRAEHARGLAAAVVSPLGFLCDHIEVLYDLDHEAAETCAEIGLPMVRAAAVNDHPLFLDTMAEVIAATIAWYSRGIPLTIVPRP